MFVVIAVPSKAGTRSFKNFVATHVPTSVPAYWGASRSADVTLPLGLNVTFTVPGPVGPYDRLQSFAATAADRSAAVAAAVSKLFPGLLPAVPELPGSTASGKLGESAAGVAGAAGASAVPAGAVGATGAALDPAAAVCGGGAAVTVGDGSAVGGAVAAVAGVAGFGGAVC